MGVIVGELRHKENNIRLGNFILHVQLFIYIILVIVSVHVGFFLHLIQMYWLVVYSNNSASMAHIFL